MPIPTLFPLGDYLTRTCRWLVCSKLAGLRVGRLVITEREHRIRKYGSKREGFEVDLSVLGDSFWWQVVVNGAMGFAEAFMDGSIQTGDLTGLLELFILNRDDSSDYSTLSSVAVSVFSGFYRASNTLSVSMANVSAHYDLSNEMFASFLSDDMTYSCPLWSPACSQLGTDSDSAMLRRAQLLKLNKVISDAQIKESDHVLEIGTGWGSFAIEAVRQTGCTVTSVTLSVEQKEEAERRINSAGFSGKIKVLLLDYREISAEENQFDKVVSIEMIEHVGRENLATYFKCISELLHKKHGIAVLQTSTMPESRYESYCRGTDFVRKHIFPGANVPSVTQIITSLYEGSSGSLIVDKLENIGGHYVKALQIWRANFLRNFEDRIRPELLRIYPGLSEKELNSFKRKWVYYFCYVEAGFKTKTLGVVMITIGRERNTEMLHDCMNVSEK